MRFLPFDYGIRNLWRSPLRLFATISGSMLVVLLVMSASAFVKGMKSSLSLKSQNHNVLLLSAGSEESLERSEISSSSGTFLAASVQGLKQQLGVTFISPEIHMAMIVYPEKENPTELRAICRGITNTAFLVHPSVEIIEGQAPRPGHHEIIVGALVSDKLNIQSQQLKLGNTLWFARRSWTIVGRFQAPSTVMNAEIWVPLTDLQIATKRDGISCVVATLDSAEFEDIDVFTKQRVDLELSVIREADYYAALVRFYRPVQMMIWSTAFLISLAGLLGGLNVMYAAFAIRVRELGMLQSLGFSRVAIVISLVQESLLATCTGALLGASIGLFFLHGQSVRFSMGVFQLIVDPEVIFYGLGSGGIIGILGAIPPAWNALRIPVPEALKSA